MNDNNLNKMATYRASCDNCATSKVRCGKEQPYCQRCFRLGQICIYSPSQRSRRQRSQRAIEQIMEPTQQNHNTGSNGSTSSAPAGYSLSPPLPLIRTSSVSDMDGMQNNMEITSDMQNSMNSIASATSPDFMNMLDDAGNSGGLFSDFDDNHHHPSLQCGDLTHAGMSAAKHEMEGGHTESDRQGQRHKSSLLFASGLGGIETTTTTITNGILSSSSAGASGSSRSNASSRSAGSDSESGQQHCELAILHMLMELGTPSPCRGRPRSSRDLGAILKTGRKTLACAAKVLECNTCPKSTNAALLVTTLLLRTLSWYELILQEQETCSTAGTSTDNSTTNGGEFGSDMLVDDMVSPGMCFSESDSIGEQPGSSVSSSDRDATASGGIVVPPMLIGSYELDAESQGAMVCHIILGDLKKIDGLAKSVSARLRDAGETAASSSSSSPEGASGSQPAPDLVAAVIRQRHGQLLRVIERKLEIPGV
ncbi:hypothetical protein B0H66DRAFT_562786 [Apodospora peruviana]|uniref:Zn(2)-C6 fungal-type domain-containing protein n=1 Tax=Apodospora peruviana TaxID=516989 RepID=A0AAE0I2R2_9PEZI|nr:hypothetical protein B0H66DRAFT_562786 [Apodospora peruviana]